MQLKDGNIQIPLLIKRDGADYYLMQYTVKRLYNQTDATVTLDWKQVCEKLNGGSSCEGTIYWDYQHWPAYQIDTVYEKVSSTADKTAVSQLKSQFFGASQVKRSDDVLTWDFKKAFYFDSELSKMSVIMVGSDGLTYTGNFTEIENEDPDAETRYRLLIQIPKEKADTLYYLRVQSLMDDELTQSPRAYEDFRPFYIYVDHQAPVVSDLKNSYKYGWSNKNSFDFSFSISDDESAAKLTRSDEVQEALERINDNKDLASVKEIRIGDLVFAKPEDGWGSGAVKGVPKKISVTDEETGESELKSVDTAYNITLNPVVDEEGVCTGKFTGTFSLTDGDAKYFSADLPLTAVDYCGLESGASALKIRLDTVAPTVESLAVDSLTDGRDGERVLRASAGKDLVVHANVSDGSKSSNIRSVKIKYANLDAQEANNDNAPKWENQMTFASDDISRRGTVAVTVEDYAGNRSTYYFGRKEDAYTSVPDEAQAVKVVTDFQAPSDPEFTALREPDFFDQMPGKKWYQNYLNMPVSAADEGQVCSEIRTLNYRINDSEWCAVNLYQAIDTELLSADDIAEKLSDGKFYLSFVPDTKNVRAFQVYLCCQGISGIKVPLSKELFTLRDSGRRLQG